jgi:hypothetical protein
MIKALIVCIMQSPPPGSAIVKMNGQECLSKAPVCKFVRMDIPTLLFTARSRCPKVPSFFFSSAINTGSGALFAIRNKRSATK